MHHFDHEKLTVYQKALDFLAIADEIVDRLPPGHRVLRDQLQRASLSIPLNIAEGAGEFSKREKARFYRIARRSATECAAILDVAQRVAVPVAVPLSVGRSLLLSIVAMLVRLGKNLEVGGG